MRQGVKMKLNELKEAYIKDLKRRGTAFGTIKTKKSHIELFLSYFIRHDVTCVQEINRKIVLEFCNYLALLENEEGKPKYNASYRARVSSTLRDFLNALFRLEYLSCDLSVWIENPKAPRRITKNILTVKEVKAFFEKMQIKTVYDFTIKIVCVLLYGTGIRLGEAISLRVEDVNLTDCEIKIKDG
jgi:site-specific recombinase XerD